MTSFQYLLQRGRSPGYFRRSYAEKDQAKVHGARWDRENQTWYAPPGTDIENLKRWLPKGILPETIEPDPPPAKAAEKGIALTELLGQVKGVIDEGFPTAAWVRAEISELRGKNGHLYLTLTERNERGEHPRPSEGHHLEEPSRGHHRQVRGGDPLNRSGVIHRLDDSSEWRQVGNVKEYVYRERHAPRVIWDSDA